jgi:hypothetical protein
VPSAQDPCGAIQEIANEILPSCGQDALHVFLNIHHCICLKAIASGDESIRQLNARFADTCVLRVRKFRQGKVSQEDLPERWLRALKAYMKDRTAFVQVLPRMAIAHICDDLPSALLELKDMGVIVAKKVYEEFIDTILECVDEAYSRPPLSRNLKERFLHDVARYSGAQRFSIRELRAYAWGMATQREEMRNKLKELFPPPEGQS